MILIPISPLILSRFFLTYLPTQPHVFVLPFSFPPSLSVCPSVCLSLSLSQVCAIRSDTALEYVQYVKYHITKENWLSFSEQKSNASTHQWRLGLHAHIPLSGFSLYSLMCAISSLWIHTCICSVVFWSHPLSLALAIHLCVLTHGLLNLKRRVCDEDLPFYRRSAEELEKVP